MNTLLFYITKYIFTNKSKQEIYNMSCNELRQMLQIQLDKKSNQSEKYLLNIRINNNSRVQMQFNSLRTMLIYQIININYKNEFKVARI